MTTHDSKPPHAGGSDQPDPDTWEVLEEYRVGDVFIRVLGTLNGDYEYILADSAAGLDEPTAFRLGNSRHLQNALRLAGEICWLNFSATMSEERAFNREFIRVGATDIDKEPPEWVYAPEEPGTPPAPDAVTSPQEPFCQDFEVAGHYGRVVSRDHDLHPFEVTFGRHQLDLGTREAFSIGSHVSMNKALWAASVIMDLGLEMSERTACGYRELAKSGVTLLDPIDTKV